MASVVIDLGSANIRVGLAEQKTPTIFPNITGSDKSQEDGEVVYLCQDALQQEHVDISHPVEDGRIKDFDNLTKVILHVLKEQGVSPNENPFVLIDSLISSSEDREKLTQYFFETLEVPELFLARAPVCALQVSGHESGVVVDCGAGTSHVVSIHENAIEKQSIQASRIGGNELTAYLARLLQTQGDTVKDNMAVMAAIKEKFCYVGLDPEEEKANFNAAMEKSYTLPDGAEIKIGEERFLCPEALFNPSQAEIGEETTGMHGHVYQSIMRCDMDIRSVLWENVLLTGGSTLFPVLVDRLTTELRGIAPYTAKLRILAPRDRQHSAWVGGAAIASLSTFQDMLIKKADFDESGVSIVNKRFQ